MKNRLLSVGIALLISTAALLVLLNTLSRSDPGINAALAAPLSRESNGSLIASSAGVSFDLHGFDAPYNADWGHWCETGTIGSSFACSDM